MAVDCDIAFGNSLAELQVKHCYHRILQGHKLWHTVKGEGRRAGTPGMLQSMGSQRVGHELVTEQQNESVYRWKLKSSEAPQLQTLPQASTRPAPW